MICIVSRTGRMDTFYFLAVLYLYKGYKDDLLSFLQSSHNLGLRALSTGTMKTTNVFFLWRLCNIKLQKCAQLRHVCLSVACNNSKVSERILTKFGIVKLYENLPIYFIFG